MLTWEFPPRVVGGISPHVYNLSRHLVSDDINVVVVTCDFPGASDHEKVDGVEVYRIDSYRHPTPNFGSWVFMMNTEMQNWAAEIIKTLKGRPIILHAHDWLVANAAIGLKHLFRIPIIATVHSTEYGRRSGLHTDYERMIHETEWRLTYEAWKIICCSDYMSSQVSRLFSLDRDKVSTIPNGINANRFVKPYDRTLFRSRYVDPSEKLVLFVGRLFYEKGVSVLIDAIPKVLSKFNAKFLIVGDGYMRESLIKRVQNLGVSRKVYLLGFVDDETLELLYRTADVCVVPSLYEPFGIVALEAMAAKVPIVATGVGGLREIIEHDKTGVSVYPNDPESLAWGITRVLASEEYAERLRTKAFQRALKVYGWNPIAKKTKDLYRKVLAEYQNSSWKPPQARKS